MLKQDLTLKIWNRLLPMEKNKKGFGLLKDELGEQIMKKIVQLRSENLWFFKRQQWWR